MRRPLILATCALALVAAGCGGSSKKSTTTAPAASSSSSSASGADANLLSGIKSWILFGIDQRTRDDSDD